VVNLQARLGREPLDSNEHLTTGGRQRFRPLGRKWRVQNFQLVEAGVGGSSDCVDLASAKGGNSAPPPVELA
jgi:hypothetical protein